MQEVEVPGGELWRIEGKKMRVTQNKILFESFHDASFMAQKRDVASQGTKNKTCDSEHVLRDCKAVAEEELGSGWNQVAKQSTK